eukprot:XP_011671070.1 PREDICTED: G-protein coupled receptor GRL101-like [Strongylocentrotus purpuratus]
MGNRQGTAQASLGLYGLLDCSTNYVEYPYRCHDTDICLLDKLRCDGWYDCPQRDDEENCEIIKCPDGYVCGEAPFNDFPPPTNFCEERDWQPFWVNATKAWNKDNIDNTANKAVILYLASCELTYLPPGVFDGLFRLYIIELENNRLTVLGEGLFRNLYYLGVLTLTSNHVTRFEDGCFQDLQNLFAINLKNNSITDFRPGTFKDIGNSFTRLILKGNQLTSINASLFYGIEQELLRANLGESLIEYIAPGTFKNLSKVTGLVITSLSPKPIPLYPEIFEGLDSLSAVYVYDSRFCCLAPASVNCVNERPTHPLFTCRKTFLQNFTIKIFMWILGISALLGNTFVLVFRLRSTPTTRVAKIQAMIITNLAVSDLLMGIYMVLLAVMDMESLTSGRVVLRSGGETSVFLLVLLSLDRFICVVFPFSNWRLGVVSTRVTIGVIWLASVLLSVGGVLLNNLNPDAYGLSDVCVGLPFIRKSTDIREEDDTWTSNQYGIPYSTTIAGSTVSTWKYSIVLFLGINLCGFVVIFLSYIAIFIKARFVRAEVGQTSQSAKEIKMALRMLLIVGTDLFCWMPIIILGILVQTLGVNVTPDIYAWLVVFVMPINSSLNPYLYTIINMVSK